MFIGLFILGIIIALIAGAFIGFHDGIDGENIFAGSAIFLILSIAFSTCTMCTSKCTLDSPLGENYAYGAHEGFLTACSVGGIIWDTNECILQQGIGKQASLQRSFRFSIPNEELFEKINKSIGKHVRIKWQKNMIQPYKRGDTSFEATNIEIIDELENKE